MHLRSGGSGGSVPVVELERGKNFDGEFRCECTTNQSDNDEIFHDAGEHVLLPSRSSCDTLSRSGVLCSGVFCSRVLWSISSLQLQTVSWC